MTSWMEPFFAVIDTFGQACATGREQITARKVGSIGLLLRKNRSWVWIDAT